jgi:hypothetical protein
MERDCQVEFARLSRWIAVVVLDDILAFNNPRPLDSVRFLKDGSGRSNRYGRRHARWIHRLCNGPVVRLQKPVVSIRLSHVKMTRCTLRSAPFSVIRTG